MTRNVDDSVEKIIKKNSGANNATRGDSVQSTMLIHNSFLNEGIGNSSFGRNIFFWPRDHLIIITKK